VAFIVVDSVKFWAVSKIVQDFPSGSNTMLQVMLFGEIVSVLNLWKHWNKNRRKRVLLGKDVVV